MDSKLAKNLIALSDLKGVRLANSVGIKSPNYYNWWNNKPKFVSDNAIQKLLEVLGISDGYLNQNIIHRWFVTSENEVNSVLKCLILPNQEIKEQFKASQIFQIFTHNNVRFSILKLETVSQTNLILCFNRSPNITTFPINADKLNFGTNIFIKEQIASDIFAKWSNSSFILDVQTFAQEVKKYLKIDLVDSIDDNNLENEQNLDDSTALSEHINFISSDEKKDLLATQEGLKALIRALLREVKRLDPKSKLLQEQDRKDIFDDFYQHEFNKLSNIQNPLY